MKQSGLRDGECKFLRYTVYEHLKSVDVGKAKQQSSRYTEGMVRDRIENSQVWIARESGKIIGSITLEGFEIKGMYVDIVCRGRGIGRALLTTAIEFAMSKGLSTVTVETNQIAKEFFATSGFKVVQKIKRQGKSSQYFSYRMSREISKRGSS